MPSHAGNPPTEGARSATSTPFLDHDTTDRLPEIAAPTLVIPGALFEVMEAEAHQPVQEVPDEWNARVDAFWREVEARG